MKQREISASCIVCNSSVYRSALVSPWTYKPAGNHTEQNSFPTMARRSQERQGTSRSDGMLRSSNEDYRTRARVEGVDRRYAFALFPPNPGQTICVCIYPCGWLEQSSQQIKHNFTSMLHLYIEFLADCLHCLCARARSCLTTACACHQLQRTTNTCHVLS